MKIIDAHMHYYDIDKFYEVAECSCTVRKQATENKR